MFLFLLNVLCRVYEEVDDADEGDALPDKPHPGIERLIDMAVCALLNIPWHE